MSSKTEAQYLREATKVGKCRLHPSRNVARRVYILRHGYVPSHIYVCHKCDQPQCIVDTHHFLGTQLDNVRDMIRKGRKRQVEWTSEMRAKKAESSRSMWADPKFHKAQKKRIKDAYAKKVWTKEELAAKSAAVKLGHITRAINKAARAKAL